MSQSARVFVDTNILVYAHDPDGGDRHRIAKEVLQELWHDGTGAVSTQVLQEFYNVVRRKMKVPMDRVQARQVIAALSEWHVVETTPLLIVSATKLEEEHTINFWDALIVEAALLSGAETLLSEDLQDGRKFVNLKVHNPFRPGG
ncbi:PIN domain-containing protein [Saccharothrix variisporea]|uniref:Putative nucleic acid-binding protein n=1 Tax=Saccharothrix variisporea TaxID=543527 RepID=A0A495X8L6_9PSEU|nr:PIN domain-containing protein [Saccharothrix variisporea]RKT70297.1 putative nucleic acid-binding protein [Saccharothrix variisporea]